MKMKTLALVVVIFCFFVIAFPVQAKGNPPEAAPAQAQVKNFSEVQPMYRWRWAHPVIPTPITPTPIPPTPIPPTPIPAPTSILPTLTPRPAALVREDFDGGGGMAKVMYLV